MEELDALMPRPAATNKKRLGAILLVGWAIVLLVAVSTLMGAHWITLPRPGEDAAASLGTLRARPGLLAVHVLYSECDCSNRVLDHLLERGPLAGVDEVILFVGPSGRMAERARARGWRVERVSRRELEARFHIVSAPLLAVLDANGRARHFGGYTHRKRGPEIRDVAILTALSAGDRPDELPLYGCATGAELARQLDPMGLRTTDPELP
jgi:hypothetical protein